MAFKIAFFDTKPYDRASFDEVNEKYGFEILYHKGRIPQLLSKWPVTGSN